MAPHLERNVIVGGVTYPAGTEETPELRELIPNGRAWSGETELDAPEVDEEPSGEVDGLVAEAIGAAVEAAVAGLREELLDELRTEVGRQIDELLGSVEPAEVVGQDGAASASVEVVEPPRGGKGSGEPEWRVYAAHLGVDVSGVSDRDGIIAAVEQHKAASR
jgi:hypothetical protein